jgi:murein DD-endopeptidase MepM/ murein hydrolase activator NlpD
LLNASVGVQRVLGRVRRPPDRLSSTAEPRQRRSRSIAHHVGLGIHSVVVASRLVPVRDLRATVHQASAPRATRRSLVARLGPDRAVAVALAGILLGASALSISAGRPAAATGGTNGDVTGPRIAVGGGTTGSPDETTGTGNVEFGQPADSAAAQSGLEPIDFGALSQNTNRPLDVEGPFIDDGTLVKPIAVDTSVPDGSALVKTYKVATGDTLVGIAAKFKVSMMTIWWANDLKSKTDIHQGEVLRIPPVTGLIVKVASTDTLDAIAARYDVNSSDILATNGLDDPNLVVGQVLVIPGAKGQAIPKPVVKPTVRQTSSGGSVRPPAAYTGGKFLWPVVGGGNYISQYFHYGHYAIDIAADYGSTVRAAASGTVTFAGWKNNGGGYQVWVAHGSGLYTTYNHMSSITVGAGQHVGQGQQVGRVGQSGNATGPHCHFEVWRGPIWDGGTRVNPLGYF